MNKICQPFAAKILEDSKLIPVNESEQVDEMKQQRLSLSRVVKNLEKLSLIVKNLTPAEDNAQEHIMVGVLKEMWGLLETFLLRFFVKSVDSGHADFGGGHLQVHQAHHEMHQTFVWPFRRTLLQDHDSKL